MFDQDKSQIVSKLDTIQSNTNASKCIGQELFTLTASPAELPFTGVNKEDVYGIEFRVKAAGTPSDETDIARFSMAPAYALTTTTGMYIGNGDWYEVTNKHNVSDFRIMASDGGSHVVYVVYYAKN